MSVTYYDPRTFEHAPYTAALLDCPEARRDDKGGLWIDTDSECYRRVHGSRLRPASNAPKGTAGSDLAAIIRQLLPRLRGCSSCSSLAAQMDRNGDEWCERNRRWIIARLNDRLRSLKRHEPLAAILRGVAAGMTFIDPENIAWSMLDEALRRSSVKPAGIEANSTPVRSPVE